jgi:uncharacterized protein YbjT (DUF2867 family)
MKMVVIGGTGLIGSKLVDKLRAPCHEATAASPDTGVNTLTGEGVTEALDSAGVVVDVSNSPSFEDATVLEFFETSTRNLLDAEASVGVGHHVALSIVGTERLPDSGYLRAKVAQEKLIKSSSIPYSIVHATQFFEFVARIADEATTGNTVRLPHVLFQPIAADDVAAALATVAIGAPINGTIEIAGPEQFRFDDLIRQALRARHDPRQVLADPHAPYFGTELSERSLVPDDHATLGATRFEHWLNEQPATGTTMTDYALHDETRSFMASSTSISWGSRSGMTTLRSSPSGDEQCENCRYYFNNSADISYCWHPKLRILVGAQWWCTWWESIPSA